MARAAAPKAPRKTAKSAPAPVAESIAAEPAAAPLAAIAVEGPAPGFGGNAVESISAALNGIAADSFALYLKTKNFHWHVRGPHFREYHLMLDDQADQIFAVVDVAAERVRALGGRTLTSIASIAAATAVADDDRAEIDSTTMLKTLHDDNMAMARRLRAAHDLCDEHDDLASESLVENWIDETEKRAWFLRETLATG